MSGYKMSFSDYLQNRIVTFRHPKVTIIENIHPDGKTFPHNSMYVHKAGYLKECSSNDKFSNCSTEKNVNKNYLVNGE